MVDYKKFLSKGEEDQPIDPFEIFNRLGVEEKINDLYQSQREVLSEWYDRRTSRDLVIKLHTGGGKTLVGMLIGVSIMNETKEEVIYLVPNNQPAEQAVSKAVSYGIPVTLFGEDRLDRITNEFLRGKKILVATYKALFNAKSQFGILNGNREIVHIGGIIVDDAHSSFSVIRESFSIRLQKDVEGDAYNALINLFKSDFRDRGELGTLNDILSGNDSGILEIPYLGVGSEILRSASLFLNQSKLHFHLLGS